MLILAWILATCALLAAICTLPWACRQLMKGMIDQWRNAPASGAGFNPLQEFVQPQIRHVAEAREHYRNNDDDGAPPLPGATHDST